MTISSVLLRWLLPILLGTVVGLGTAWWATGETSIQPIPGHPEWRGDMSSGSTHAGAYTRARIARTGLLALSRDEAVYYIATRDHDGRALTDACSYEVTGKTLPGQWWALTLYASDLFLPRNDDHANDVGSDAVAAVPDSSWSVRVAATRDGAANWLSTRDSGDFSLTLRLYQPDPSVLDGKVPNLPDIRRTACQAQSRS